MKYRKNIVFVLVVLILMVSTMILFFGCNHKGDSSSNQGSVIGVWKVDLIYEEGSEIGFYFGFTYYIYFTKEGKYGKILEEGWPTQDGFKYMWVHHEKADYTVKNDKIIFKFSDNTEKAYYFYIKGDRLFIRHKNKEGKNIDHSWKKTSSPSLDEAQNAK